MTQYDHDNSHYEEVIESGGPKMWLINSLLIVLLGLSVFPLPYQKIGWRGGYSDTQLSSDTYIVSVQGSVWASNEKLIDFALLRAFELCHINEAAYLYLVSDYQFSDFPRRSVSSIIKCSDTDSFNNAVDIEAVAETLNKKYKLNIDWIRRLKFQREKLSTNSQQMTAEDKEALNWARQNPNEPDAVKILDLLKKEYGTSRIQNSMPGVEQSEDLKQLSDEELLKRLGFSDKEIKETLSNKTPSSTPPNDK
jgi:ribosomal protein L29